MAKVISTVPRPTVRGLHTKEEILQLPDKGWVVIDPYQMLLQTSDGHEIELGEHDKVKVMNNAVKVFFCSKKEK